jgi:ABC-2 type transport system permease protein
MLLSLIVVFIFVAFGTDIAISWHTLYIFPLLLIELVLVAVAVSFFLSAVFVKFRDIDHIWEVVRQALFYSIPIIYPLSRIPPEHETIQQIMLMNPLVQIIEDARSVITYSGVIRIPDVFSSSLFLFVPLVLVAIALVIGISYFNKRSKYFAELV